LNVVDVSDPANPWIAAVVRTPGDGCGLSLSGDYVYMADGLVGLLVIDIVNPEIPEVVGNKSMRQAAAVFVSGEHAYITDGSEFRILPSNCSIVGLPEHPGTTPALRLQAFPNPTSHTVEIRLDLAAAGSVRATILDVAGRQVRSLHGGVLTAGRHSLVWDGLDDAGRGAASGVYLARVSTSAGTSIERVAILR
jgi:hypothetical protein